MNDKNKNIEAELSQAFLDDDQFAALVERELAQKTAPVDQLQSARIWNKLEKSLPAAAPAPKDKNKNNWMRPALAVAAAVLLISFATRFMGPKPGELGTNYGDNFKSGEGAQKINSELRVKSEGGKLRLTFDSPPANQAFALVSDKVPFVTLWQGSAASWTQGKEVDKPEGLERICIVTAKDEATLASALEVVRSLGTLAEDSPCFLARP